MKLDAVPPAPGLARKFVESKLPSVACAQREAAALVTSEMVTAAVLGAGGSLEIGVATVGDRVVVAVHDWRRSPADAVAEQPLTTRVAGMIGALADDHGMLQHEAGRTMWASLHEHGRAGVAGAIEEGMARHH